MIKAESVLSLQLGLTSSFAPKHIPVVIRIVDTVLSTIPRFKQRNERLPFVFFEPPDDLGIQISVQLENFLHSLTLRIRRASSDNILINKKPNRRRPGTDLALRPTAVEENRKVRLGVLFDRSEQ